MPTPDLGTAAARFEKDVPTPDEIYRWLDDCGADPFEWPEHNL